jgi:hypothetical protein
MTGRPTDYNEDIAAEFCSRIADGASMRKVCAADDMPDKASIFRWIAKYPSFSDQYARACSDRREVRKEQLFDVPLDPDIEPARGRLLSDNIKWVLAKEEPRKYGEKIAHEVTTRKADELSDDELAALASGGRAAAAPGDSILSH